MRDLELVHVKVVGEVVVAGGPPSCWQCSREVVEYGIRGVWLYTEQPDDPEMPDVAQPGVWRYRTGAEFHRDTLLRCSLPITFDRTGWHLNKTHAFVPSPHSRYCGACGEENYHPCHP